MSFDDMKRRFGSCKTTEDCADAGGECTSRQMCPTSKRLKGKCDSELCICCPRDILFGRKN